MTRLALCLLLLATLAGCEPMTPEQVAQQKLERPFHDVSVHHDDVRAVTCWIPRDSRAGLSCLPDWTLKQPPAVRKRAPALPARTAERTNSRSRSAAME